MLPAVIAALDEELRHQVLRWGVQDGGVLVRPSREVQATIGMCQSKLAKANDAITEQPTADAAISLLREVAALCVACFEEHGVGGRGGTPVVNRRDGKTYGMDGKPTVPSSRKKVS